MRKQLQSGKRASKRRASESQEAFAKLLAERARRADRHHGSLQVALALAAATDKVRVDAAAAPFEPKPADLFDKTFDDASVALNRAGMAAFKGNLGALLPGIAADVGEIPNDPSLGIRDVARYVALSLVDCTA